MQHPEQAPERGRQVPNPSIEKALLAPHYKPDPRQRLRGIRADGKARGVTLRKIGRNERCPCGSGNKYKRCHLLKRAAGS